MCRDLPVVNTGVGRVPDLRSLAIDATDGAYAVVGFLSPHAICKHRNVVDPFFDRMER